MKEEALMRLLEIHKPNLAIVFCNTKRKVDRLVESLTRKNYLVDGLHGDLKQGSRDQVMKKFRNKTIQILVATDIAARGLDVDDVDIVFNYDLPQLDEYYVHRIGRTARAGKSGLSFSLISGRDNNRLRQIENYTKANIKQMPVPTLVQMDRQSDLRLIEDISSKLDKNEDLSREKDILIRLMEKGYDPFMICQVLLKDKLDINNNHEKLEGIDLKSEKKSKSKSNNKTKKKYDKEMTTLFMNRGKIDNFTKDKIIKALARMAKVPKDKIGQIRIQKTYSFIDIEKPEAFKAIRAIDNKKISSKKVKIEESNK